MANNDYREAENINRIEQKVARRKTNICKNCNAEFFTIPSKARLYCSRLCCTSYLANNQKPFRSKSGYYQGILCQSSWEFAFVYLQIHNGITVIRNKDSFAYADASGRIRRYFPDFIVDGEYIEIKGWKKPIDEYKFAAFPYNLKVLERPDMTPILTEVEHISGLKWRDFYRLYT